MEYVVAELITDYYHYFYEHVIKTNPHFCLHVYKTEENLILEEKRNKMCNDVLLQHYQQSCAYSAHCYFDVLMLTCVSATGNFFYCVKHRASDNHPYLPSLTTLILCMKFSPVVEETLVLLWCTFEVITLCIYGEINLFLSAQLFFRSPCNYRNKLFLMKQDYKRTENC